MLSARIDDQGSLGAARAARGLDTRANLGQAPAKGHEIVCGFQREKAAHVAIDFESVAQRSLVRLMC